MHSIELLGRVAAAVTLAFVAEAVVPKFQSGVDRHNGTTDTYLYDLVNRFACSIYRSSVSAVTRPSAIN